MKKKKVLITGVAGFIGYHLAKRFLDEGWIVAGIDNIDSMNYGSIPKVRRLNRLGNLFFHAYDLANRRGVNFSEFDLLINCAAYPGVRNSIDHAQRVFNNNTAGLLNILESCSKQKKKPLIIHLSSSSVYGNNKKLLKEENAVPSYTLSPYAASKRASELLLYPYHYLYKQRFIIVRPFTVYGEHGRPDGSILRFIEAISKGEELELYGNGKQKRGFTYIDDFVDAIWKLKDLKCSHEVFNVGGGEVVTINKVIKTLEKIIGKKANIKRVARHEADILESQADLTKIKKAIDWSPKTSMADGLRNTCIQHVGIGGMAL